MYIGGVTLTRSDLAIIALCLCLSVIVGFLSGSPAGPRVSAYLAGILLFVALVWDIRLVVPVLIFSLPFGPRFQMSAGNLYLSTVIVIIAYAAWLIRSPLSREGFSLAVNPVIYGVLALMAAFLVSALQNVSVLLSDRAASLRFIQFYLYAGLFILIWQMNFKRDHIKMLLSLVIAAGIIEGILGGWQWLKVPGMYVFGTFDGEHNNFSCYVTFTSVLLLGVALRARRPLLRVACLAAIAISLYSIVFSFSRTAYISLGISLIAFLFMPLGRLKKMILIIVSSVGTLAVWLFIPVSVAYRALDIYSTFTGGEMALSFTHRVEMWRDSWMVFLDHPILGIGVSGHGLRDNLFVRLAAGSGLVGLVAFLAMLYLIFKAQRRVLSFEYRDDFMGGLASGFLPASIGFLIVFNLSGDFLFVHRLMGTFWIVLALMMKYCSPDSRTGKDEKRESG